MTKLATASLALLRLNLEIGIIYGNRMNPTAYLVNYFNYDAPTGYIIQWCPVLQVDGGGVPVITAIQ